MGLLDSLALMCWECGITVKTLEEAKRHQENMRETHDSWRVL